MTAQLRERAMRPRLSGDPEGTHEIKGPLLDRPDRIGAGLRLIVGSTTTKVPRCRSPRGGEFALSAQVFAAAAVGRRALAVGAERGAFGAARAALTCAAV